MCFKTHLRALFELLIDVPKMDTWRGCADLSLDRPDP